MKQVLNLFILLFSILFLVACGDSSNNPVVVDDDMEMDGGDEPAPDPDPEPETTTFAVSVELPVGSTVVQNKPFNPIDWLFGSAIAMDEAVTGLDLSNFEVRLYDADGVNFTLVEIDEFIDNGDGTYFISAVGEPRIDCILVSVLQVDGNAVELQVPATSEGTQEEPIEINYASTAATTQYIESVVEAGGFSEELSVEEVDALIEEVVDQVASVILPDDVDPTDPNAVIAALEEAAGDLVEAQIEIASAPEPEVGSLAAFAGNYHGNIFGRNVFADFQGFFGESEVFFEDFTFAPDESEIGKSASLGGIPITVNEADQTAALILGSEVETIFGVRYEGQDLAANNFFEQEAFNDDEQIPATILPSGKLIVDPGTGNIDEGFLFIDENQTPQYFAEINNSLNFELIPWGEAYVSSAYFRFDEYRLNSLDDPEDTSCFEALGFLESDLAELDEDSFDALIASLQDPESDNFVPNAAGVLVDECSYNAVGSEVVAITLAKEGTDLATSDLTGSWGVVGFDVSSDQGAGRGAFSSVITIDAEGNLSESDFMEIFAFSAEGQIFVESDVLSVTEGSASVESDGIVTLTFADGDEDEFDLGYVSSDLGLLYAGSAEGCCLGEGFGFGEAYGLFGAPLSSEAVSAADLVGKTFEFVGLGFSLESEFDETFSGRFSANHDSMAGFTVSFAANGDDLEATLGGSSDLGTFDLLFGSGGVLNQINVDIELNDPADGTLPGVDIASNGAISIRLDGDVEAEDDEDLLISGFLDANGRMLLAFMSGSAGMLQVLDAANASEESYAQLEGSLDFVNFGYLLGTCIEGCEAAAQ